MGKNKPLTRRDFIKKTSLAAAGGAVFLTRPEWARLRAGDVTRSTAEATGVTDKTKVVLVRNEDVLDENGKPKYEVVLEMLDAAVTELTGRPDPVAAWKSLIKPDDVVGIKSNVWRFIPTPPQVEQALKKRVLDAGVDESNIAVSDRGVLKDPVFQKSTALINARPMRSHHWSGVGSLIKNYIMFVPAPWDYHDDSCTRLATIWDNPLVKGKTRLNALVMLTPQFHGVGPHNFNPKYVWSYHGFIVSFDPVAADSVGLRIIQAKRREFFGEDRPLNPPAKHIFTADTVYGLGTADPEKINLITLGYDQDILI
jgi:hypothetical protein